MLTDNFFNIAQAGHEVTLWLLIVLSVLSVSFILERYFSLKAAKNKSFQFRAHLTELIQNNQLTQLDRLSQDPETLEGRGLSYALRHIKENGTPGLEEVLDTYAILEKPRHEKFLNFLATVGSNAPFIGLLGTVFGIMDAFRELATSQGDANAVMIGISKALVATAVGLLVAIPAVIAYNYFQKQVKSIFQGLESLKDICLAYSKIKKPN